MKLKEERDRWDQRVVSSRASVHTASEISIHTVYKCTGEGEGTFAPDVVTATTVSRPEWDFPGLFAPGTLTFSLADPPPLHSVRRQRGGTLKLLVLRWPPPTTDYDVRYFWNSTYLGIECNWPVEICGWVIIRCNYREIGELQMEMNKKKAVTWTFRQNSCNFFGAWSFPRELIV